MLILGVTVNKKPRVLKVKEWLENKPAFVQILPYRVRRINDGAFFDRLCDYKYQYFDGKQFYYNIENFMNDGMNVHINIFSETLKFVGDQIIHINHLEKPVRADF